MAIHHQVLAAARRLCRAKGSWTFSPNDVVRALPNLKPGPVRTHIVSRCCVNAPRNHPHKWDYFRRLSRARYEILPAHRRAPRGATDPHLRERPVSYGVESSTALVDTVHAIVRHDRGTYAAECLELAVVTQGASLDELIVNLREAITLHLQGEDSRNLGVVPHPRLSVQYELAPIGNGP